MICTISDLDGSSQDLQVFAFCCSSQLKILLRLVNTREFLNGATSSTNSWKIKYVQINPNHFEMFRHLWNHTKVIEVHRFAAGLTFFSSSVYLLHFQPQLLANSQSSQDKLNPKVRAGHLSHASCIGHNLRQTVDCRPCPLLETQTFEQIARTWSVPELQVKEFKVVKTCQNIRKCKGYLDAFPRQSISRLPHEQVPNLPLQH